MAGSGIGVTTGVQDWDFQNSHVERMMDNAAYSAAHPDDTLVLAGPPRYLSAKFEQTSGLGTLLAIGMLQGFQITQSKPTQPMMALGSGRSFYVSGKAQTQWNMARLFVNGRNLLRVLYHNAVAGNLQVQNFDDPAARDATSGFFANLDSELYYVPFGLACFFRNKTHDLVGSFYAELCMINSYAMGANAGQNMILENVSGLADRLLPMNLTNIAGNNGKVPRATVDAVIDFVAGTKTGVPAAGTTTIDDAFDYSATSN